MSPYYVDEAAGSDTTGQGTQDAPYQSLAQAIFAHGEGAALQIRKSPEATYDEPTQSALKKAKKNAEGIAKRIRKAEELAERAAKEKGEEREKRERERSVYSDRSEKVCILHSMTGSCD